MRRARLRQRRAAVPLGFVAAAAALAGCATGPAFTEAEVPPAGRAVVYVYRASALPGAAIKHDLFVDGRPAGHLLNGSYVRVELPATARPVRLHARGCMSPKEPLLLQQGDVAYVQLGLVNRTVEFGGKYYFDYGCQLQRRDEGDALPTIVGLRSAD